MKQLATVIIFSLDADKAQIERIMQLLVNGGLVDQPPKIETFNPDHGEPVFYIP